MKRKALFLKVFFPKHPADNLVPPDPDYPCRVEYIFRLSVAQLHRCIARLSPYKAPREDGIPNIVIKESLELIAEYLLKIFEPCSHFALIATVGEYGIPSCSTNWANQDMIFRRPTNPLL